MPFKQWIVKHTDTAPIALPFLSAPLPLPAGETEESLKQYLASYYLEGSRPEAVGEIENYLREDLRRFLYTLSLIPPAGSGKLLEIGSNPYFTSMLIRKFTKYELVCTNYFGPDHPPTAIQTKVNAHGDKQPFEFHNFNIESDRAPFPDGQFDVVIYCEVLEHMTNDPVQALLELKRVLKPNGHLIITTPNVSRLENVARMISGTNMYDPYSGYGPYGRHNREYNKHELSLLMKHLGFTTDVLFTSDVHENRSNDFYPVERFLNLVMHRKEDLGQYNFLRAQNTGPANLKRPQWLYRSLPPEQLSD